jgi:hypothetical protein
VRSWPLSEQDRDIRRASRRDALVARPLHGCRDSRPRARSSQHVAARRGVKRARVPPDGPNRQRCPPQQSVPPVGGASMSRFERNGGSEFERLLAEPVPGVLSSPLPLGRTGIEQGRLGVQGWGRPRRGPGDRDRDTARASSRVGRAIHNRCHRTDTDGAPDPSPEPRRLGEPPTVDSPGPPDPAQLWNELEPPDPPTPRRAPELPPDDNLQASRRLRSSDAHERGASPVRRLVRLALITVAIKFVAKRLPHTQSAYRKAVASGARPIEAVGTAVAAFVGLGPGGR